jgi:hypothetical protein
MAFVVFSLPRSRSAWLSVLLSTPEASVGHDLLAQVDTLEAFVVRLAAGTCETGAGFAWPTIRKLRPDIRFAVVRRDPGEVMRSLRPFGLLDIEGEIRRRDAALDELAAEPGTLSVPFEDLASQAGCGRLYAHCLGRPMPSAWWRLLDPMTVELDVPRRLRLIVERRNEVEGLIAEMRT